MTEIIFESHATSVDNEIGIASGHADVGLSFLGHKQAEELGVRYKNTDFDAIFCPDLKRAYSTAEIAFAQRGLEIIKDSRLRECNYGDFTKHAKKEIDELKKQFINTPFPKGESYTQTARKIKSFLEDLNKTYNGKKVMIIGCRATQYGLEHWLKGVTLEQAVTAPWQWQPGWVYYLDKI